MTPQPAQLAALDFEDGWYMEWKIAFKTLVFLWLTHEFLHLEVSDGNSRHDSDPGDVFLNFCQRDLWMLNLQVT